MSERLTFHCRCGQKLHALEKSRGRNFSCPSCGTSVVVPSRINPLRGKSKTLIIFPALLCAVATLGFLLTHKPKTPLPAVIAVSEPHPLQKTAEESFEQDAVREINRIVLENLIAPKTAEFSSDIEVKYLRDSAPPDLGAWFSYFVDAQNQYGVPLRKEVKAQVNLLGDIIDIAHLSLGGETIAANESTKNAFSELEATFAQHREEPWKTAYEPHVPPDIVVRKDAGGGAIPNRWGQRVFAEHDGIFMVDDPVSGLLFLHEDGTTVKHGVWVKGDQTTDIAYGRKDGTETFGKKRITKYWRGRRDGIEIIYGNDDQTFWTEQKYEKGKAVGEPVWKSK
ncbi:hypothetical protein SH661x_003845 [Planctomicrobium sp. SH661]|uniref:hypothetical protein n=1 Tax=Planctomicrobium sp. SH661 TaxID=3448124 RepID=UPI003F5C70FA